MEFRRLAEKGHVTKDLGVTTQVRMVVEVGTLLLSSDKTVLLPKMY